MRWLRTQLAAASPADRLLAVGLAACGLAEIWLLGAGRAPRGLASAAVAAMTLPLALRRRRPLLAVGTAVVAFAVLFAASDVSSDDDAFVPWFVMLVVVYTAGAHTRGRAVAAGAVFTLAIPVVISATDRDGLSLDGIAFFATIALPPFLAGVAIARHRRRETELERHAATIDADRERAAAAAVTEERARIARELHDVVAHAVSTMVVQAQGGHRMVRLEPGEAEEAFLAIEGTGRRALAEMRRLLGMLRAADERAALAPQPGVEQLGDLIQGVRAAGLPVALHVEGPVASLPPGVDVSAYRIVQEALTNTLNMPARRAPRCVCATCPVPSSSRSRTTVPGTARAAKPTGTGSSGCASGCPSTAADGEQAVAAARRLRPQVAVMDVRMPRVDGLEATRRLPAAPDATTRVLILTTFDLDEYVYDALRAGASGFLLKDGPAEQLVAGIRTVADGGALLAPTVTRRLIEEFARRAPPVAPASLSELTARERTVLEYLARGRSKAEIAAELVLGEATIKTHVARVLSKLGLRDRTQAVVYAYESGLVRPEASR